VTGGRDTSGSAHRYQVVLLPAALETLDRLERETQATILDALEREIDLTVPGLSSFELDGRTYYEAPITPGAVAVVRPLTEEEFEDRVARTVLAPDPVTAYAVFAIDPPGRP
jgi:hypothetical protein